MTLEHHPDLVDEGLALPIYDVRAPKFSALLASYLDQIQQLEDALWGLYTGTMLDHATGDALDQIGALVGQPRNGMSDDDYRLWIRARVQVNASSGTPEQILELLRLVIPPPTGGATPSVYRMLEIFPAYFRVDISGPLATAANAVQIAGMLEQAKAAGVATQLTYSPQPESTLLIFGDANAPSSSPTTGLSNDALAAGGYLVGVATPPVILTLATP